jgi:hypothetical protein
MLTLPTCDTTDNPVSTLTSSFVSALRHYSLISSFDQVPFSVAISIYSLGDPIYSYYFVANHGIYQIFSQNIHGTFPFLSCIMAFLMSLVSDGLIGNVWTRRLSG